jgi:hypothetical protein
MNPQQMIAALRKEVIRLENVEREAIRQTKLKRQQLQKAESECVHQWTEPKYEPVHYPSYVVEGDPPGTMGVDHRPSITVPARTVRRWIRFCELCELVQETSSTRAVKRELENGVSGYLDEPYFSGIRCSS